MTRRTAAYILALSSLAMFGSAHGTAQGAVSPETASTRLITLGTAAGPSLRPDRVQSSNVLTVNGTHYLIDAGDGVARRLEQAGVDVRDIKAIFLTHHHDDHTAGLGTLVSIAWTRQRVAPINVYGPPRTAELAAAAAKSFAINGEIRLLEGKSLPLSSIVDGHDVGVGTIYEDANVKVSAVENSHFDWHPGERTRRPKSYSYRFETPHKVIVFTGDTGPSDAVARLARGADLLVAHVESFDERLQAMIKSGRWQAMTPEEQAANRRQADEGHMSPAEAGAMATHAKVRAVILTHLGPRVGTDDYTPWSEEVRKVFAGQILIAKDLMVF